MTFITPSTILRKMAREGILLKPPTQLLHAFGVRKPNFSRVLGNKKLLPPSLTRNFFYYPLIMIYLLGASASAALLDLDVSLRSSAILDSSYEYLLSIK